MRKPRLSTTEKAKLEKKTARQKACRAAILKRLRVSPASILQLDALGYTQREIDKQLNKLLHRGQVFFHFPDSTYRRNFQENLG